jgi:predicted nucleic acid-binding Zn ribbon protein
LLKTGRAGRSKSLTKSQPKAVGSAIQELAKHLGLEKNLEDYQVITSWPDLVGEQIAKVTQAQRMENGVLFIGVSTAPWRAELSMKRMEIMQKINGIFGKSVVKEIRFR